jgi:hypothetical protein
MRLARIALLAAVASASEGCLVSSLQPFYDGATIEFDAGLLGTWDGGDEGGTLVVERGEWRSYDVSWRQRGEAQRFTAHVTHIGGKAYANVTPALGLERGELMLPAHALCRVERSGDTLALAGFDADWFARAAGTGRVGAMRFAFDVRRNLVLTSDTPALRAWVAAHDAMRDVFAEPVVFTRR